MTARDAIQDEPIPPSPSKPTDPNPWAEYERRKHAWKLAHRAATGDEIEQACRRIADELGL